MVYIYVLDYSTDNIYEVEVESGSIDTFDCLDAEKLLVEKGFELDEIHYMITEFKQDIIDLSEKHNNNHEVEIWIARDKDKSLWGFIGDKPYRLSCSDGWGSLNSGIVNIDDKQFSHITWEDEPVKAKIVLMDK